MRASTERPCFPARTGWYARCAKWRSGTRKKEREGSMTTPKGGQTLRGSVKWMHSKEKPGTFCWHARFTLPNKERTPFVPLYGSPSIGHGACCETNDRKQDPCEHVLLAQARAKEAAERVRQTGGVSQLGEETVAADARRWGTRRPAT